MFVASEYKLTREVAAVAYHVHGLNESDQSSRACPIFVQHEPGRIGINLQGTD